MVLKRITQVIFIVLLSATATFAQGTSEGPPESTVPRAVSNRPNVVWIVLDACRARNLSCYGYDRPTSPTIDKVAREGILFEQQYTQGLWTKLSVPSYMTGKYYPVSCLDFGGGHNALRQPPEDEVLLPVIMRNNGYRTIMISAHGYMSPYSRLYRAFDEGHYVPATDEKLFYASYDALNEVLQKSLEQCGDKPIFLYIHAMETHFPHLLAPPYNQWIPAGSDSAEIRDGEPVSKVGNHFSPKDAETLRGMHDGGIRLADDGVAKTLALLKDRGLLENTLLLIGSDHGEALGEDGVHWGHEVTYDEVTQTPFIMAGPGLPRGKRIAALTENTDILPTLVELLQLKTIAVADGKSMVPLWRDSTPPPLHEYVFTRLARNAYDGRLAIVLSNAKYKFFHLSTTGEETLYNIPDSVAGRTVVPDPDGQIKAPFQQYMKQRIDSLWDKYTALPPLFFNLRFTKEFVEQHIKPKDAIIFSEGGERPSGIHLTDGKWTFWKDCLWAAPWSETPPPLTLTCESAPQKYLGGASLLGMHDYLGHPASALRVQVSGNPASQWVEWRSTNNSGEDYQLQSFGVFEVAGGNFSITISCDPGKDTWALIGGVWLTGTETPNYSDPQFSPDLQQEQLRALGYL